MTDVDVSKIPVLPRNSHIPLWHSSRGDDAVALAALCKLYLDDWQQEILRGLVSYREDQRFSARRALLLIGRQQGKCLDVETPVVTANRGWVRMGDLVAGDVVFHPSGRPVEVEVAHPVQYGNECFRVTTTDGRSLVADADHLWTVVDKRGRETTVDGRREFAVRTVTTREMFESGVSRYATGGRVTRLNGKSYETNEYRYMLPRQESLQLDKRDDLPIDPYLFGAWLGDGASHGAQFFTGAQDVEHWRRVWGCSVYTVKESVYPGNPSVTVLNVSGGLRRDLRALGVHCNKHVPDMYLLAGDRQREALLQGLLDTDGSITAGGQVEFCNTNRALAEAVLFLVRSLGWRAVFSESRATLDGADCGPKYRVRFTPKQVDGFSPFRLPRKLARVGASDGNKGRHTVSIKSIDRVESVPVRCIKVASDDGLFLAGRDLVATHNTVILEARDLAGLFLLQEKVMLHTAHEYRTAVSTYRRVKEHIENGGSSLPVPLDKIRFRENTTETSITIPKITNKAGKVTHSGSFLQFTPRTSGAGRGLTVELLVVDEAYAYTSAQASALDYTQNQSQNPQLIVTSSTGFPDSTELLAMRELGLSGEMDNLLFCEYKAEDGSDPADREQWYHALPGLRTGRTRLEEVEAHFMKAKALGDFTDFNREIRGLWATNDVGSLIPKALWESLAYPQDFRPAIPPQFAFAVDVDPLSEGASIYAVGQDQDGFFFMWQAAHEDGVTWVAEWLKIQQEQRPGHYVTVIDPMAPVGALKPQFDDVGVEYVDLSSAQCVQACIQFESFARDGRLRHGVDPLLDEAVNNGVKRNIGSKGGWLWAPKLPGAEIRPLVASTYALFGLTAVEPPEKRSGEFW